MALKDRIKKIKKNNPLKKINLNLNETILFTDHIDDLSLIRKVKKTFAFYPLANNIKFMKNKYKINIIDFYNET